MAERVDRSIERALKKAGVWTQTMRYRCLSLWKEAAGDRIASHARPVKVNGSELLIYVASSAWRQELQLLSPRLIEGMNRLAGGEYITAIRFTGNRDQADEGATDSQWKQKQLNRWVGAEAVKTISMDPRAAEDLRNVTGRLPADLGRSARQFFVTLAKRKAILRDKGWRNCKYCGALSERDTCPACEAERREKRGRRAVVVLGEMPWLSSGGLAALDAEFRPEDYLAARDHLLSVWSRELQVLKRRRTKAAAAEMKVIACNMVMLITGTPPDKLDQNTITKALDAGILKSIGIENDGSGG